MQSKHMSIADFDLHTANFSMIDSYYCRTNAAQLVSAGLKDLNISRKSILRNEQKQVPVASRGPWLPKKATWMKVRPW